MEAPTMTIDNHRSGGLHVSPPVLTAGTPLDQAEKAMVLVHGRGGTARDILSLTSELDHTGIAYSFLAPIANNEPHLSQSLDTIRLALERLAEAGIPPERTALLGFSQGACLVLEFAARNARRYGGIFGLSGGLIGPNGTPRDCAGSLEGTPVFLGCSDVDPHIPQERVIHSSEILQQLGAKVTMRIYPGMGHTVNEDELALVRENLARL
jgi:dienelactone hydrolase